MPTAKKAATPTTPAAKKAPPAKVIKAAEVVKPDQPAAPQENVLSNIVEKVNAFVTMGKELQGLVKVLSKEYEKQQKIIEKVQKKRQKKTNIDQHTGSDYTDTVWQSTVNGILENRLTRERINQHNWRL